MVLPTVNKKLMEFSRRNSFSAIQDGTSRSKSPRKNPGGVNTRRGSRRESVMQTLDKQSRNFAEEHRGPKLYNSKGLLDPINLQHFLKDCYKKLTNNEVLDLLFYCRFDFEASLTSKSREAFLARKGDHWLSSIYSKWLQRRQQLRAKAIYMTSMKELSAKLQEEEMMNATKKIEQEFAKESTSLFQQSVVDSINHRYLNFKSESTKLDGIDTGFDFRDSDQIQQFSQWEKNFRQKYTENVEQKIIQNLLQESDGVKNSNSGDSLNKPLFNQVENGRGAFPDSMASLDAGTEKPFKRALTKIASINKLQTSGDDFRRKRLLRAATLADNAARGLDQNGQAQSQSRLNSMADLSNVSNQSPWRFTRKFGSVSMDKKIESRFTQIVNLAQNKKGMSQEPRVRSIENILDKNFKPQSKIELEPEVENPPQGKALNQS